MIWRREGQCRFSAVPLGQRWNWIGVLPGLNRPLSENGVRFEVDPVAVPSESSPPHDRPTFNEGFAGKSECQDGDYVADLRGRRDCTVNG